MSPGRGYLWGDAYGIGRVVEISLGWVKCMLLASALAMLAMALLPAGSVAAEDIEPDFYGLVGQPLALNVDVEPGGPVDLYHWDLDGDGVFDRSSVQANVTHTYNASGTYQAVLRANLTNGSIRMWLFLVEIAPRNQIPVVVIIGHEDDYVETDRLTPVELLGTATDDGQIVLYEWDFEGDGIYDWSSPVTKSTNHTFTQLGTHVAVLRATDDQGANGMAILTVHVINLAPVMQNHHRIITNRPDVELNVYAEDLDGEIVTYTWTFDDGSEPVKTTVPRLTHIFLEHPGYYLVQIQVLDNDGASSTVSYYVEVKGDIPFRVHHVDAGPDVFTVVGKAVQFNVNVSEGTEAIEHYYWDLTGDGVTDAEGKSQTYVYDHAWTYEVTVSVVDEWGYAVNDSLEVTVYPEENEPPVPVPSVEQWVRPGRNLRFSEESYDPDGSIVLYQWDFDGDGTFDHADPTDGNVTHLYVDEGVYVAVLQVTDNRGEVASVPVTIKVSSDAPDEDGVDDSMGAAVCCISMVVVMVVIAYWTMRKSAATPRKDGGPVQREVEASEEPT